MRPRPRSLGPRRPDEIGQALVEFAIVTPLVVLVILFSIWFYELLFVKLKAQEAARYAAWEATAYPMHDYANGSGRLSALASTMTTAVTADTVTRYSMSSLQASNSFLAASFTPPTVLVTNGSEERVPGGWMPNLLVSVAGNLVDWLSALNYENPNPVAVALIATGKAGQGHALESRMFGNSAWAFNTRGYVKARVGVKVTNGFFRRGVGKLFVSQKSSSLTIWDQHSVLVDTWALDGTNHGQNVYGNDKSPGVTSTAFGKQVERMYLVSSAARGAIKPFVTTLWAAGNAALGAVQSPASAGVTIADFTRPVVVSRSYGDTAVKGKVRISQDRPGSAEYDTAPATKTAGSAELKEYGKTLDKRGTFFMGCDREMSLGCPSSTLEQDNPFGSYLVRE